ncbi:hypothetical protein FA175_29450 [Pseudomonas aeruginosa]|nr:hypothetical protein [Pseudomonas aeruginosa]MCO2411946.1 hypothetical protein [Pseudomonas aeruginosa]MCO3484683.1 hypothetical protein [Pseudomonas aeruginosa]
MAAMNVKPGELVGRSGGSFQEVTLNAERTQVLKNHGRYCTIRDNEIAPPTSVAGRYWLQIYRTPDNTE